MPDDGKDFHYPPSRFTSMCKLVNSVLYPNLEIKAGADERERKRLQGKRKENFQLAKRRFETVQKQASLGGRGYRHEEKRFLKARESYKKDEKTLRDLGLKKVLGLARLDIEPYELRSFSNTVFVTLLMLFVTASLATVFITEFDLLYVMLCLIATISVPGLTAVLIDEYPHIRAKRMRALTVGRMPEAIHYLSLSMRLTPSLDRAVKYASSSLTEPLASDLRKVLWDVYMREYSSIEDAFIAFAYDWSEWDDDFKRSLYMVRSATLERTREGIDRVLDKANQIIIDGTKSKLEEFSTSLRTPALVLFGIGIMLPLLLVILLPILGIGQKWTGLTVIAINIVLPLCLLLYTYNILGKRPELTTPPLLESSMAPVTRALIVFLCLVSSAGLFLVGIMEMRTSIFASLSFVWAIGLPIALYCLLTNMDVKKKARAIRKMEAEYPEALFQLGNRMAEGKPIETALSKTAETMKNTLISKLFNKISYNLQVTRSSLKEILFGATGLLVNSPARTVKNTMHTVVEASSKDPHTAGKTIMLISNYLSDLKKVEREMKEKLYEITGMMTQTAVYIAPLVVGVTVILYQLLSSNISNYEMPREMDADLFGMGQDMVSPMVMGVSLGVYLIQLVLLVAYFVARIEYGKDGIELKNTVGWYLIIALAAYSIALLVTYLLGAAYISDLSPASGLRISAEWLIGM